MPPPQGGTKKIALASPFSGCPEGPLPLHLPAQTPLAAPRVITVMFAHVVTKELGQTTLEVSPPSQSILK